MTGYLLYKESKTVKLTEAEAKLQKVFCKGCGGGINEEALVKEYKVSVCTR